MGASCSQWIACSPVRNGGGGRPLNSVVSPKAISRDRRGTVESAKTEPGRGFCRASSGDVGRITPNHSSRTSRATAAVASRIAVPCTLGGVRAFCQFLGGACSRRSSAKRGRAGEGDISLAGVRCGVLGGIRATRIDPSRAMGAGLAGGVVGRAHVPRNRGVGIKSGTKWKRFGLTTRWSGP